MISADPRSLQLDELSQYAFRMGVVFGDLAERAEDLGRQLAFFQLFDRCFFSVRVATGLQLRLRREPVAPRPTARAAREDLSVRAERDLSEQEPADAGGRDAPERYTERDQERERETVSFPILLRTLGAIAVDAAALPGPEPSALPDLRELLAKIASAPAGKTPITTRRTPTPSGTSLRARLATSASTPVKTLMRPKPPASGVTFQLHRATGPPRR